MENLLNFFGQTSEVVANSFKSLYQYSDFLPNLLLALVVFGIGLFIASVLGRFTHQIVSALKLNKVLQKMKVDSFFKKAGYKLDAEKFLCGFVFWVVALVSFLSLIEILGLTIVSSFILAILTVVFKIFIAFVIIGVSFFVARFVKNITIASAKTFDLPNEMLLGDITKWIVMFVAVITVMDLFGVFVILIQYISTILAGIVFALSLAFGLAFGLGGKDMAAKMLEKCKNWK